jgi:ubiquitin carboxyl-terminal hydrolase 8
MSNKKGYVGLENLGNTCFLNSCLQIMKEIKELPIILFNNSNQIKHNNDGILCKEWYQLNHMMATNNGTVRPSRFLDVLQNYAKSNNKVLFSGFLQNDVQEFFLLLITVLHNSISKKKNISINGNPKDEIDKIAIKCYNEKANEYKKDFSDINELFQGISVTFIKGLETNNNSFKPDLYTNLILPVFHIDDNKRYIANNLYDCLNYYVNNEELTGENKWLNENTNKKENAIKYTRFWDFPKILFILLKRFTPDGRQKINNVIDFPINDLDLSPYVCGYKPQNYKYELFGVCNHSGGLLGGHYTAYVKNKYNEWIHYNDTNINIVHNTNEIITAKAYCLFYRKKNN